MAFIYVFRVLFVSEMSVRFFFLYLVLAFVPEKDFRDAVHGSAFMLRNYDDEDTMRMKIFGLSNPLYFEVSLMA